MYQVCFANCVDDEEKNLGYSSGSKCLSVLAFVDPIPAHLRIGSGTMFFFSHRKSGLVDRVRLVCVMNVLFR